MRKAFQWQRSIFQGECTLDFDQPLPTFLAQHGAGAGSEEEDATQLTRFNHVLAQWREQDNACAPKSTELKPDTVTEPEQVKNFVVASLSSTRDQAAAGTSAATWGNT